MTTEKTAKIEASKGKKARRGFVYFVTDDTAIKIGFSGDVDGRIIALQTSHHRPLKLMASIRGLMIEERAVQAAFAHLKIKREWYVPANDLKMFINALLRNEDAIKKGQLTIMQLLADGSKDLTVWQNSKRLHESFSAWMKEQSLTDEAQRIARFVQLDLECFSMATKPPPTVLLKTYAAEVANLERAVGRVEALR